MILPISSLPKYKSDLNRSLFVRGISLLRDSLFGSLKLNLLMFYSRCIGFLSSNRLWVNKGSCSIDFIFYICISLMIFLSLPISYWSFSFSNRSFSSAVIFCLSSWTLKWTVEPSKDNLFCNLSLLWKPVFLNGDIISLLLPACELST